MEGGVLNVADYLRINRPGIGAPGRAAEVTDGLRDGTARNKIAGFRQASDGGEDSAAELPGERGDKVAESMKRQGDSIFNRAIVHCGL